MSKTASRNTVDRATLKIHELISNQLDVVKLDGKSQREVALEVGYDKPNMINMFRSGTARVPLEKVPALAKALHIDPAFLFRLAMMQYWKEDAAVVAQIFGTVLTDNEAKIIEKIRSASKNTDPELTRDREAKLKAIFSV